jgi:general secretion pathway protein A
MLPVYCDHFGLTREPFNVTPDPSFLYLSSSHKEALAQLVYGIRTRRGFVVLTGEVGTGKTTLIQSLLEEISDGRTHSAFLFDLTGTPKDLLRSLCQEFALASPLEKEKDIAEYLALLNRFLLESYQKGDNVAVIIDEAQNLPAEVLERVRLLSNFETRQEKLLQIVLVGQPELSERLNAPELRQLKQRVALRHHLTSLNLSECKQYITKRLEISGGAVSLFSAEALETVHAYSAGTPRLINILCDNGLLSAYALRKPRVEPAMIEEIAEDLQLTVPHRGPVNKRESLVGKPKAPSIRERLDHMFELREAEAERRDFINGKALALKPAARAEPTAGVPKRARTYEAPKTGEIASPREAAPVTTLLLQKFFQSLTGALTDAVGPMAGIIVEDHVAATGETKNTFPMHRLQELVDRISGEIANRSMKEQFVRKMRDEIFALNGGMNRK